MSGTKSQQLMGTEAVRKLLSRPNSPPIQEIIDAGLIPKFVEFLDETSHPKLQFEAAWVLINIASGTSFQTNVVIESGAIPIFVRLVESNDENLQEQAVWALGNIAGDSARSRDIVINTGVLKPLLKLIKDREGKKLPTIRNSVWFLCNLCRGKPSVALESINEAFPLLNELLRTETDHDIINDTCWSLSYISDGSNEQIQAVLDNFDLTNLTKLLNRDDLVSPVLRVIGNIVTGDDVQTQTILNLDVLKDLLKLLDHNKESIVKETCWTVSNITAGTKFQIQAVIDACLIPKVVSLYEKSSERVKTEIVWVIANATSGGTREQISYLVSNKVVELILSRLSSSTDSKKLTIALEALENILRTSGYDSDEPDPVVSQKIEKLKADIEAALEKLLYNSFSIIYDKAQTILDVYF